MTIAMYDYGKKMSNSTDPEFGQQEVECSIFVLP